MVANPRRRALLADAGLRVLADTGARGLTHRAVDRSAGVPEGTAANYFRSRDELLSALGERVFERLAPDPARLADLATTPPGPAASAAYIDYIVERTTGAPDLMRALFELRLEGVRRPELGRALATTLNRNFELDVAFNAEAGLPGGRHEIALLHFAIDGLLLDRLTTSIGDDVPTDEAARALVERLLRG